MKLKKLGVAFTDSAMRDCIRKNDVSAVKLLLDRGMDPNTANQLGQTFLHVAAQGGSKDVIKALSEKGASPNLKALWGILRCIWPWQTGMRQRLLA